MPLPLESFGDVGGAAGDVGRTGLPVSTGRALDLPEKKGLGLSPRETIGLGLALGTGNTDVANLFLQQKFKGQQLDLEERKEKRRIQESERDYALKVAEFAQKATTGQITAFGTMVESMAKFAEKAPFASVEERTTYAKGVATAAKESNIPFTEAMAQAFVASPDLATVAGVYWPFLKDSPYSAGALVQLQKNPDKGPEILRAAAMPEITADLLGNPRDRTPGRLVSVAQALRAGVYGDKPIPFDIAVNVVAASDPAKGPALAAYMRGQDMAPEQYTLVKDAMARHGIEAPAAAATTAEQVRKATTEGRPEVLAATEAAAGATERGQQMARNAPAVAAVRAQAEAQVAEAKALIEQKYRGTGPLTVEQVGALRDDYTKASTTFIVSRDSYLRMESAAGRTTSASDITRLYAYIKMQDPNAVREGELALVRGTGGVIDQAADLYNRLMQGTAKLTPVQRRNLETEVREMFRDQLTNQLALEADFKRTAQKRQADPDEVVLPSVVGRLRDPDKIARAPVADAKAPPATVTLEDGRRELNRLMADGYTKDEALAAMKKAGWK